MVLMAVVFVTMGDATGRRTETAPEGRQRLGSKTVRRPASSRHAFRVIGIKIAVARLLLSSASIRTSREFCVTISLRLTTVALHTDLSVSGRLFAKSDVAFCAIAQKADARPLDQLEPRAA